MKQLSLLELALKKAKVEEAKSDKLKQTPSILGCEKIFKTP